MKKRIISLLLAFVMIFGCCSYAATSYANDLIDSTLTLDATSSTAEKLVFTGTDSVPNGTTKRYKAGDEDEEGIFVNATKNADLYLRKRNGKWDITFSEAAVADTTVTIKGTFTNSTTSVRIATISVKYNGSAWEVVEEQATSNQSVTLTGLHGNTAISDTEVVLWIEFSGGTWSDWSDWGMYWEPFTYVVDGVEKQVSKVQSAGTNLLYVTIPVSDVSTDAGTRLTIKAGDYAAQSGTTTGMRVASDFEIVMTGDKPVVASKYDVVEVGSAAVVDLASNANQIQFTLTKKDGTPFTFGYHTEEVWNKHFLTPVNKDGNRCAGSGEWNALKSGVFQGESAINYWPEGGYNFQEIDTGRFYIGGLNAVAGTTVTVKGAFVASDGNSWAILGDKYTIFEEIQFTYDGATWSYVQPAEEITLTGLHGNTANSDTEVVLWIEFSGGTWSDWSDWGMYWEPFTYVVDGVEKQVSKVQSAGTNLLYVTIPVSDVSTDAGTRLTMKAGDYAAQSGTTTGMRVASDFEIVMTGDKPVVASKYDVVEVGSVAVVDLASNANQIQFSLTKKDGTPFTFGYHTEEVWNKHFLTPVNKDGNRCAGSGEWNALKSGVFQGESAINYWPEGGYNFQEIDTGRFYIGGLNAVAGTTVTVKGAFVASDGSSWAILGDKYTIFEEIQFTYDGSTWSYVQPSDDPTITEHAGTPVFSQTGNDDDGFYFTAGETAFPFDAENWTVTALAEDTETSGVFLNGNKTAIYVKKVNEDSWYVCVGDASITPSAGDVITVKGTFVYEEHKITFTEAKFTWDGSKYKAYVEYQNYTGTPVFESPQADGFYFTAGETEFPYDEQNWTVLAVAEDENSGIFLSQDGGATYSKLAVNLQKVGEDRWFAYMAGDTNVTLTAGDIALLKGAFVYENHKITFSEAKFVWDGTVWGEEVVIDEDNIVFSLDSAMNGGGTKDGIYLTATDSVPYDLGWNTNTNACVGVDNGVFLNGVKTEVFLKKYESNKYYVCLWDVGVEPKDGDTVTVKGAFKTNDYVSSYQEYTLTFKNGMWLDEKDLQPVEVKEKNVKLTLDKETFGWQAGSEAGIYLFTEDHFAIDANWRTPIYAVAYDDNSGIFFNGKKVHTAYLKKHADGMIYLDIAAADIFAEDMDSVTIKGTFVLDGYGVSYAEQTFYYNGQKWDTTYSAPIPRTLTKLSPIEVSKPSSFNPERKAWDIYVKVDGAIPGGHDYEYKTLIYEVNGKSYETSVYRVEDKLVFFVPETVVPKDAADGTAITLKAGTASDNYGIYDIELTKDCTAYVYRKAISGIKPTDNTPFMGVTIPGLIRTWSFNEEIKEWQLFFIVEEKFDVEDGTQYYDLPVKLNGKSYEEINVFRSGECLYISIPESVLPRNTKSASLTIAKGAKAVANAGWNGIRLNNEVKAYMFDGVWNNIEFTEHQDTDLTMKHMNFCSYNADVKRWDIYVNVDKEIPGTAWFEYFDGLTAYLNGKEFTTYANKAESENNRLLYISLDEATFGKFKDGDVIYIPAETIYSCGGYRLHNVRDFYLQYANGTWMEYYESDVKAPEAMNSLWENFRIDGYIPVQEEQGIMFTNVAPTNVMKSVEDMKDVTFTFETTKMLAMNEELPTNSLVLRGQPLNEEMGISETALYGYNISFSYIELTESNMPNNPELWGTHSQEIAVWKNGINYQLLDQYRMSYNWQKTNHPFFEYNEKYKYTVSIYNVEEDVCMIEVYCNDELVMCVVDHASDDPRDPARNGGEFQIYASCPQYFYAPEVELDTLEASATECYLGEQVRVSATYPAVLEGAEYSLEDESEGVTLKDGVFSATKVGTYTVRGSYNGEDKGTIQIKVTEKPQKDNLVEETSTFPIIPVAIGGGAALVLAAILVIVFLKKKKNTLAE